MPGMLLLADAWRRSDAIFDLLAPEALLAQPIPLRQPFIFYLGHLPAFAWNQIGRHLGRVPFRAQFDALFERGIDPVGVDAYVPAQGHRWPPVGDVRAYRDEARAAVLDAAKALDQNQEADRRVLGTVLEHELMHQETLLYMVRRLPLEQVRPPATLPAYRFDGAGQPDRVELPPGSTVLGASPRELEFGWDNEFPEHAVAVDAFAIDTTPVRNGDFLKFMEADGFARPELWTPDGWAWRRRQTIWHPPFWRHDGEQWLYRALFHELPLERVLDWPVSVSWAAACAFARWRGCRLPSEAELHRAMYTTPDGDLRIHPWGDAAPAEERGNFGFRHWAPTPVGSHPAGASGWGVLDAVGNGWEWTSTAFAPFPGFEAMPNYQGYSADFFDGCHFVMLGASWVTDTRLVRRSFRNWFQPNYPYVFAKFRCAASPAA